MDTNFTVKSSLKRQDEHLMALVPECIERAARKVGNDTMFAVFAGWSRAEQRTTTPPLCLGCGARNHPDDHGALPCGH